MKYKKSLTRANIFTLGAINGLIVGLALEKARLTYLNHQMTQAAREYAQTDFFVDFIEARWQPLVPLISIAVFAVVAYLIYECFLNRPRLLLLIWFGMGIVALAFGYFMSTSNPDIFSFLSLFGLVVVSYLVHRLWENRPDSLPLFWVVNGISALVVLALGVQLAGLFLYWKDLRSPLLWLVCVLGVVATNAIYGALVHFIFDRFSGRKLTHANS